MDMSSMMMGSMSMGVFAPFNMALARDFWYIIAGILGFVLLLRGVDYYQTWSRIRTSRTRRSVAYPTKVNNLPMQIYATLTAIVREATYPVVYFDGRLSWLTPPSMGRVIVIFVYWAVIAYMMFYKSFVADAYYWERVAYRGAWVSVTQVPLVYLLAMKSSIIGVIIGSSHERLNWLHRWVSRTLLVTVTIHGTFFLREWIKSDFIKYELAIMPMVKYGMGAWGILVWNFFTAIAPMRWLGYEVFVLQHIAGAGVFLWLLWVHVPAYAQYNIVFAIVAISFDWVFRGVLLVFKNLRLRAAKSCHGGKLMGHEIELQAMSNDLTVLTIKDIHMSWKAGQHIYLWLPYLGPLESHPFTIASPYDKTKRCTCNSIQLAIRTQKGISKRMHNYTIKNQGSPLTGFILGPYGAPPAWEGFETMILISASTGASFTLPILERLLRKKSTICTQRIFFLLVARSREHIEYYIDRLTSALSAAEERGIELQVEIAITNDTSSINDQETTFINDSINEKSEDPLVVQKILSSSSTASSSLQISKGEENGCCCDSPSAPVTTRPSRQIIYTYSRPSIAAFIRGPVEMTGGETSVAVCGGKSLVADVRNSVARLSDERAVHKGTGAQGIHLHVEEYCF